MEITVFYFYTVSFVSYNQLQNFVFAKLIELINMYEITCMLISFIFVSLSQNLIINLIF